MKKASVIVTILLSVLLATIGCGAKTNTTDVEKSSLTEPIPGLERTEEGQENEQQLEEVLDLTGMWVQEDPEETYMTALIKNDGTIGAFFIIEGDEVPWTYWVGTYEAPEENTKKYSWTSQNTYAGNGLLASSADTKRFDYKSDKLIFDVSIQGETRTVSMVRGEWDTSNIPTSAFGAVDSSMTEVLPLEIIESGWIVSNGEWLDYYVKVYNPNPDIIAELPSYRVTARDSNGILLGTHDHTLSVIYPQQEFVYGSLAFSVDEVPDRVEFEALEMNDYNLKKAGSVEEYYALEPINTGIRSEKIVGEINNPNAYDIGSAVVVAIIKDETGTIRGIENTFVDRLPANGSAPFEIGLSSDLAISSYDIFANQW